MSDIAIRVENLSKLYRIGTAGRPRYETLYDKIAGAGGRLLDRLRRPLVTHSAIHIPQSEIGNPQSDYIWALKDVSFEVKRGEVVGIIGRNGAGKSTLLKILSRITEPTEGRAYVYGRVGSLLEVGTGFHPELTGRENIYLNGAILGMRKAEIDRKFDEIVAFAEIEKFIDTPVKFYSSGMYVRLAFAVAAHLDPEILLVDEVLAVGDAAFQKKCLGKMGEVAAGGRTVLFVSHNMAAIQGLCGKAMWVDAGHIRLIGLPEEAITEYVLATAEGKGQIDLTHIANGREGSGVLRFTGWSIVDERFGEGYQVGCNHACEFRIRYESDAARELKEVSVALTIKDIYGTPLLTGATVFLDRDFASVPSSGIFVCRFDHLPLLPNVYKVHLWCKVGGQVADRIPDAGTFRVVPEDIFGSGRLPQSGKHGFAIVPHSWWRETDEEL